MNDIEDLRDAMNTTPGFEPKAIDLATVMTEGGRIRRRRRFAVTATSGVAVLALLVGGAQFARQSQQGPAQPSPAQQAGAPVAPADPSGGSQEAPVKPAATGVSQAPVEPSAAGDSQDSGEAPDHEALGEAVETGITTIKGEPLLLWMYKIDDAQIPDTRMGMVAGRRGPGGKLVGDIVTNETEGSDRAPGFHGLEMAMNVDGGEIPAFGYYVGDAAKIMVTADGKKVTAKQATWSEDASVKLFWFSLKQVGSDSTVGKASAYDKNGRKLAAGHAGFGVG